MSYDAVIIGAGIVGTACAYRLASEGLKIAIVEEKYVASGVTAAGMGHIVVMDDSEAQFALTNLSRDIWRDLALDLPAKSEYENCGTIWVAVDDEEMDAARTKGAFYNERACRAKVIGSKELYRLEPNLRPGLAGGLLVEDDSVVYQLCAAGYFADKVSELGAEIRRGVKAVEIVENELSLGDGTKLRAKHIINSAGIFAPKLSPELRIEGKKGHLTITDRYPGFIKHQIVELGYLKSAHQSKDESVAFNVQPRITGQVLIGSSRQPAETSSGVDVNTVSRMLERAFQFMPGLRKMSGLRTWTGTRPATNDNLPFIGRSSTNKHVIVAAGHEGLGITTATGTAELVADEIFRPPVANTARTLFANEDRNSEMKMIEITINGTPGRFSEGTTVAAALLTAGVIAFRTSVAGEPRGAFCGMGICFECRVTINGIRHERSCQTPVKSGMTVNTDGKE